MMTISCSITKSWHWPEFPRFQQGSACGRSTDAALAKVVNNINYLRQGGICWRETTQQLLTRGNRRNANISRELWTFVSRNAHVYTNIMKIILIKFDEFSQKINELGYVDFYFLRKTEKIVMGLSADDPWEFGFYKNRFFKISEPKSADLIKQNQGYFRTQNIKIILIQLENPGRFKNRYFFVTQCNYIKLYVINYNY